MRHTKAERDEAREHLRKYLEDCGPHGRNTLFVQWYGSRPTSDGRSDRYELRVWTCGDKSRRPESFWQLSSLYAVAFGARYCKLENSICIGGYGEKAQHIATRLAGLCGHPIYMVAPGIEWGRMYEPWPSPAKPAKPAKRSKRGSK